MTRILESILAIGGMTKREKKTAKQCRDMMKIRQQLRTPLSRRPALVLLESAATWADRGEQLGMDDKWRDPVVLDSLRQPLRKRVAWVHS